jgi:hypothetical protein
MTNDKRLMTKEAAPLNVLTMPMTEMQSATLRNQIEQGSIINLLEFPERHRVAATLNPKSKIRNPKFN